MSARHTPGPWSVVVKFGVVVSIDGGVTRHYVNGSGEDQLFVVCGVQPDNGGDAARNANAFLVAAAPELLSDLRDAASTLRRYEELHRAKRTAESDAKAEVNAALAARFEATIAKATGIAS